MGDLFSHKGYTSDSTNIELLSRFLTIRSVKILPHALSRTVYTRNQCQHK